MSNYCLFKEKAQNGKICKKKDKRDNFSEKIKKNYKRQNKGNRVHRLSLGTAQIAGGIAGPAA